MFPFFRKTRKKLADNNQFLKYSGYAVGEILLVVIGILIALQVNNLNEKRKERRQTRKYLVNFSQELEKDISMIKVVQFQAEQIRLRINHLSSMASNTNDGAISNLDVVCLTWLNIYRPYSWNRSTLEELKSSGGLKLIENSELSNKIVSYDAFTHHLDEDYNTDKVLADEALSMLSNIINYKYPNGDELYELLRVTSNKGNLDNIFSSKEYIKSKSYNLQFISNDYLTLNSAVNNFIRLSFNLKIRTKIELPQLIGETNELNNIIKAELDYQNF